MAKNFQESNRYPKIITGFQKNLLVSKMWATIFYFIVKIYKRPSRFFKIAKKINSFKKKHSFDDGIYKLAQVDGRVFFNFNVSGWPSKHFTRIFDIEAQSAVFNDVNNLENLRMVLIAFTKKCPLNCEHCYEGDILNNKDTLSLEDHKMIVEKLQDARIPIIHFGGGEPMTKVNELIEVISTAERTSDFWIFTSGFNFTERNAFRLKKAGLTGVSISLDHHEPDLHNTFRRNNEAFNWVQDAAKNASKAKLVITFSICVTNEYCTKENLLAYINLAYSLGASFIQLLEPRSVGNYAGKNVNLTSENMLLLEEFLSEMNTLQENKHLPIVQYPGLIQRKIGCPGAGSKYLYIDTDGYMSSCPFCKNKKTHILADDHESSISEMINEGCDYQPLAELPKIGELLK